MRIYGIVPEQTMKSPPQTEQLPCRTVCNAEYTFQEKGCPSGGCTPCTCCNALERIAVVEQRHPDEWLAFLIPVGEDEYRPEYGILIAHSTNDNEVWHTVGQLPNYPIVHAYFNGSFEAYLMWLNSIV